VVSISQGGNHGDPHDGTDTLSETLDDLCGPGRLLCCAAGNEGREDLHVRLQVRPNESESVPFVTLGRGNVPLNLRNVTSARISGWLTDEGPLGIAMRDADLTGSVSLEPGEDGDAAGSIAGIDVRLTASRDPRNDDWSFSVRISSSVRPVDDLPELAWRLDFEGGALEAPVIVDAWSHDMRAVFWDSAGEFSNGRFPPSPGVGRDHMIARPAVAASAIAVAATTSRSSWEGPVGERSLPWATGSICPFSNAGPTRDGRQKPEIAAPGAAVLSLRSRQAEFRPEELAFPDLVAGVGTSQAAPVVAGILALLLQLRPNTGPEQAKALLQGCCAVPEHEPGHYDPAWGYGQIDLGRLLRVIEANGT